MMRLTIGDTADAMVELVETAAIAALATVAGGLLNGN